MSRTTLCIPPDGWEERVKSLGEQGLSRALGRTLLSVELCIRLVDYLGLASYETVGVVPALLSGVPLHDVTWTNEQRHAIANVRQIAPYASVSAWRNALETYAGIAEEWRHYAFPDQEIPESDDDVDDTQQTGRTEWFVCRLQKASGAERHVQNGDVYNDALTKPLEYRIRGGGEFAKAGETYRFLAADADGAKRERKVTLPEKLPMVGNTQWFSLEASRSRQPITIHLRNDLCEVARYLDDADEAAKRKSKNWLKRLGQIRYRRVNDDGTINESCPDEITLEGFHHAAGMVASGKSTLAFLVAAWIIRSRPDLRISIVVGDVQSSLRFADELNTYFAGDIETGVPVAVPLLGRRNRDKHLRDLHGSRDYRDKREKGTGHWGERFLSVVCPLQSLVPDLAETPLPSGEEPCANLQAPPAKRKKGTGSDDLEAPREKYFLCPFYARCPVQQLYHDMASARVWITTPWAMAYGSLPRQVEQRPVHFGEIIYERSDIVIFDEADVMMSVFDEVFAEVAELANGKDGIYDRIGTQTERFTIGRRSNAGAHRLRWSQAQRNGQNASQILLMLLTEKETAYLHKWLERTQFTPHGLMVRLVRMICGLAEFPRKSEEDDTKQKLRFEDAFEPFRRLFEIGRDPVRQKHLPSDSNDPAYRLWRILIDIDGGVNVFGDDLLRSCKRWLTDTYPDIQTWIDLLNERRKPAPSEKTKKSRKADSKVRGGDFENLDRLAYRLILALAGALLDRNTEIVLYEWHSRAAPDENDVEPHRRMPAVMRDILPLPPIGRQFGTYFAPGDDAKRNTNRLSYLSYTNVGRWYLLQFHRLRTDLEGTPGPHVLALSGTSYLPDSTRLHVGTKNNKPQGLLLPEQEAMDAIGESVFRFLPLSSSTRTALRISGTPERQKPAVLVDVAEALAQRNGGKLANELALLKTLGETDPKRWADRSRLLLLVNSYEQSRIVGDALRNAWPSESARIYHLARTSKTGEGDELIGGAPYQSTIDTALNRSDIETFAQTDGSILVAPMSSIGRGFNILNSQDPPIAAFGAVYFLVRPYPHPDDMTALARELNRRTLDWAEWDSFSPWNEGTIEGKFRALRRVASDYWHDMERRKYWSTLHDRPDWLCEPRKDLAAFTAGLIVQAVGRLLRGGVPFHAFFCDAAFAPNTAKWYCGGGDGDVPDEPDAPVNSLLAALIDSLREQVATDHVARMLYEPLSDALCDLRVGIAPDDYPFEPLAHWQKLERKR